MVALFAASVRRGGGRSTDHVRPLRANEIFAANAGSRFHSSLPPSVFDAIVVFPYDIAVSLSHWRNAATLGAFGPEKTAWRGSQSTGISLLLARRRGRGPLAFPGAPAQGPGHQLTGRFFIRMDIAEERWKTGKNGSYCGPAAP